MFRISIVFGLTAVVMMFVFNSADWYSKRAALPRFCENPVKVVEIVEEIITEKTPIKGDKRRPYIVAAKLIFLVPRKNEEPMETYKQRLRDKISQSCGTAY